MLSGSFSLCWVLSLNYGGREVSRSVGNMFIFLMEKEGEKQFIKKQFFFRKDDLSVLESGECQSLLQVCFSKKLLSLLFPYSKFQELI